MTSMVQADLGPSALAKYKDGPIEDSLRHSGHHLQQPRSASIFHQKHPPSPRQLPTTLPSGPYGLSHPTYAQHPQDSSYYQPSHPAYSTASSSGHFGVLLPDSTDCDQGPPDLMATTAQMQRPYPPIYHTPQSGSPASVASQSHDQHARSLYAQSPQMTSQMYGYQPYSSINPVQPSPYAAHHSPQPHPLTSQPLMIPSHQPSTAGIPSPGTAAQQQQQQQPTPPQRAVLNPPSHATNTSAPVPTSNVHHQSPGVGTSSSAAPGPIPATTPLVVRQDGNGVQWIAFEYSRERIKMEYTIRCDVESVNVDNLSQEFKTDNCVYPRACCNKDSYKGNRLVYETECNAVGWALAELNVSLRGKRGLIQRAVDSWRNSNQDPRLRSRRVRRMSKINRRQTVQPSSHMAGGSPITPSAPGPATLAPPSARPSVGPMPMGPPQLHHHHHAQPDGSSGHEDVSGTAEYTNASHRSSVNETQEPGHAAAADIRPAQVFHGYQSFPPAAATSSQGPSMPPLMGRAALDTFGRPPTVATSSSRPGGRGADDIDNERHPSKDALFGPLPDGKRRKFILVDDNQRGCRVRVKVMLDQVDMDEIPDSYRMSNSVYPRTYFPVQLKNPPGRVVPGKRYFKDDTTTGDDDDTATEGRVTVPAPSLDGDSETTVPKISRQRHRKDVMMNDLGYRMSWSQSRVFSGRPLFLQRSLDAYRNKMRNTMLAGNREPSSIPDHFETRAGKRRFLERGRQRPVTGGDASRCSAEEVE